MEKMKVVQCWDDGTTNDIGVTELLRKYHAKATFNLNPGRMPESGHAQWPRKEFQVERLTWQDIPEIYDGFELASHCWLHENAKDVPAAAWIESALHARKFLEDLVQKPCTGFAWPYGATTPECCKLLRENGFSYGRNTQYLTDLRENEDAMSLCTHCHFLNADFYKLYEEARKSGIFYFWGHSYELRDNRELWDQFEAKIRFISEDPEAEWAYVKDIAPLCDKNFTR